LFGNGQFTLGTLCAALNSAAVKAQQRTDSAHNHCCCYSDISKKLLQPNHSFNPAAQKATASGTWNGESKLTFRYLLNS
jgi:hypothetical protein